MGAQVKQPGTALSRPPSPASPPLHNLNSPRAVSFPSLLLSERARRRASIYTSPRAAFALFRARTQCACAPSSNVVDVRRPSVSRHSRSRSTAPSIHSTHRNLNKRALKNQERVYMQYVRVKKEARSIYIVNVSERPPEQERRSKKIKQDQTRKKPKRKETRWKEKEENRQLELREILCRGHDRGA